MANEFYQTLGVAPDASEQEIKRAYFRLVRVHPPEKDPEQFQTIRRAYEILRDPKSRANYDSLQSHGQTIRALMEEAENYSDQERWGQAASTYQKILSLAPGLDWAQDSLGLCYIELHDWERAERVYQELTEANPTVPLYWSRYGYLLYSKGKHLDQDYYLRQAMHYYLRAKELEPRSSKHYVDVASCHVALGDYPTALEWVDAAIYADNVIDRDDLDLFSVKAMLQPHVEGLDFIPALLQEIRNGFGQDQEVLLAAAHYFAGEAVSLLKARKFLPALALAKLAQDLDPTDSDIKELHDILEPPGFAELEFRSLRQDPEVLEALVSVAALNLMVNSGEAEDPEAVFDRIIWKLMADQCQGLTSSLHHVQTHYPWTWKQQENGWKILQELAGTWSELTRLRSDYRVVQPLTELAVTVVLIYYGLPKDEEYNRQLFDALASYDLQTVYTGAKRVRDSYGRIYEIARDFFDNLIESCERQSGPTSSPTPSSRGQAAGSGCLLPVLLLVALMALLSFL
ncbi:J domain-containing protein [Candidatus Darwinibacter acetoxidans]